MKQKKDSYNSGRIFLGSGRESEDFKKDFLKRIAVYRRERLYVTTFD